MWPFFGRDNSNQFPYEIKERYCESYNHDSCINIHKGLSKSTKENATIFVFDKKSGSNEQYEHIKACIKRLKTLRHPSILTFLNSHETDSSVYFATEYVEPLSEYIERIQDLPKKDFYLSWGILNIVKAVSFLNDAKLRHNNISMGAVFVNGAGEWKLGDVGYVSESGNIYPNKIIQDLLKYDPPEIKPNQTPEESLYWSIDSWGLGALIWEVYNGKITQNHVLKNTNKIPSDLRSLYSELVASSPQKRISASKILERSQRYGSFFKNEVVDAMLFLDEIHIKSKDESKDFFSNIMPLLEMIPSCTATDKLLPQMVRAFEYGCEGSCLIQPMMEISKSLQKHQYQQLVVPFLLKLFASTDRATRSLLLQNIEHIVDALPENIINDNLFPLLTNGFMDTNPRIREETIKAIVHLAPKLNSKNLNEEVLRHFARLQAKDEQGGIRTNTTVCLGKIAYCLSPQNRKAILLSAFLRALNDPFPPVRNAGVLAFAVSQQYFGIEDVGKKILPALCQLTVDSDKSVRDNTFRTVKGFIGKLESVSENPSLQQEMETEVMSMKKPVPSWAEWAATAVASKFTKSSDNKLDSEDRKTVPEKIEKPIGLKSQDSFKKDSNERKFSASDSFQLQKGDSDSYDSLFDKEDLREQEPVAETKTNINSINISDDCDWDNEAWISLEDAIPEEKPEPKPAPVRKTRPVRESQEKKKRQGPMKLGIKTSEDIKFD